MKLANFFLMTMLVGTLGVLGCGDDTTNPAGSGGSGTAGTGGEAGSGGDAGSGGGTAGTGGGGSECDRTAAEVCAECDAPDRRPDCETRFDACLADPPTGNFCEKCAAIALEQCGAL